MSQSATASGYPNLKQFQEDAPNDVETALLAGLNDPAVCSKCHVEKMVMSDGYSICPHCNAIMGKCGSCSKCRPVFQKICEECRTSDKDAAERMRKWGQRRGKALNFAKRHCDDAGKCVAILALCAIAVCLLIPLVVEVEHLVKMGEKMAEDIEGGVAPILTEGGRILGYAGRNTATALRILETPLNFTGAVLEDAEVIIKRVTEAATNPRAAFMAYNRVTGTTIICDDGTEYPWSPMVMHDGIVTNPYSGCVLHQTKLNGEEKFFPGKAPAAGDIIEQHKVAVAPFRTEDLGPRYLHANEAHLPTEVRVGKSRRRPRSAGYARRRYMAKIAADRSWWCPEWCLNPIASRVPTPPWGGPQTNLTVARPTPASYVKNSTADVGAWWERTNGRWWHTTATPTTVSPVRIYGRSNSTKGWKGK